MTLKPDHQWLPGLLVCAVAILVGWHKADPPQSPSSPADPKAEIYNYLAKKSGQMNFTPGIDLDLPKQAFAALVSAFWLLIFELQRFSVCNSRFADLR